MQLKILLRLCACTAKNNENILKKICPFLQNLDCFSQNEHIFSQIGEVFFSVFFSSVCDCVFVLYCLCALHSYIIYAK